MRRRDGRRRQLILAESTRVAQHLQRQTNAVILAIAIGGARESCWSAEWSSRASSIRIPE
jgi:hypothetical protein